MELGRSWEAMASMRAALDLAPEEPIFNGAMVEFLLTEGKVEAARSFVDEAHGAGFIDDAQRDELKSWIGQFEAPEYEQEPQTS